MKTMAVKRKILRRTQFGNPILRNSARLLRPEEISSVDVQNLISDMRHTLRNRKFGIGLAAPQVGIGLSISVIGIKPTPARPNLKQHDMVIINPKIIKAFGKKTAMWEGCVSLSGVFALVPRYEKVTIQFFDENGKKRLKTADGILAHVFQHEIDHLNGILYVDKVVDTGSYMSESEYIKMIKSKKE